MRSDILELEYTYNLKYSTKCFYPNGAKEAIYELLVLPESSDTQSIKDQKIVLEPNKGYKIQKNYLGFDVLSITILDSFFEFYVEARCTLSKKVKNIFNHIFLPIDSERDELFSLGSKVQNTVFLQKSRYTAMDNKKINSMPLLRDAEPLFEYLSRLNSYIYENFEFCNESTDVHTTALETLEIGRGVCQDFAHIFIGICRAQGIAARYVSGYLHQGHGYKGDAFLHAWAEVLIPSVGWIGFDPTNNLCADEHYIKIAHGVDYSDCTPIKGVLKSSGEMSTQYSVYVRLVDEGSSL